MTYAIMDTFINSMQLFMDTHDAWENNATGLFMKIGNIYKQLDNTHLSVPEHSYQNDTYSYQFCCII